MDDGVNIILIGNHYKNSGKINEPFSTRLRVFYLITKKYKLLDGYSFQHFPIHPIHRLE